MRIVVYTHIWLACIAALLTWECSILFPSIQQSFSTAVFAAASTLFVYNAHTLAMRYVKGVKSELSVWSHKHIFLVWSMCISGLIISLYIIASRFTYSQHLLLASLIVLCCIYESSVIWSRKIEFGIFSKLPFVKSVMLALVWAAITSILPISEHGFEWVYNVHCMLFFLIRFFTCLLIVILFDCRDIASDTKTSVKTIPSVWGMTVTTYISYIIGLVIIVLLLFIEIDTYFIVIRLLQIALLLFFLRIRNSMSFGASMLFWDGVLIISPLTALLLFSI